MTLYKVKNLKDGKNEELYVSIEYITRVYPAQDGNVLLHLTDGAEVEISKEDWVKMKKDLNIIVSLDDEEF